MTEGLERDVVISRARGDVQGAIATLPEGHNRVVADGYLGQRVDRRGTGDGGPDDPDRQVDTNAT